MKANFRDDIVVHGFRHAMRDRLRAVSCPSEMIDQIGGWSSGKIGEGYGQGYTLNQESTFLQKVKLLEKNSVHQPTGQECESAS